VEPFGRFSGVPDAAMKACRVTFHDAVYHAIDLLRKGVLVTADEVYFRKARSNGPVVSGEHRRSRIGAAKKIPLEPRGHPAVSR
jgi:hypothetical protein